MIKQEYGKEYKSLEERENFLKNTCDGVEEISYSRMFTPEELAKQREILTEASIELNDIEDAKKAAMDGFKEQAKPYIEQRNTAIKNLKSKSEVVVETCFKYVDKETRMVGFYNANGDLVSSRPAFQDELQKTVFAEMRTGTQG